MLEHYINNKGDAEEAGRDNIDDAADDYTSKRYFYPRSALETFVQPLG